MSRRASPHGGFLFSRGNSHHRMNLPHSVVRHVLSTVALIFGSMVDVPKRFPDNGDDRRVSDVQLQVCSDDLNLAREPRLTITRYANKDMCCIHHNSPLKDGIIAMDVHRV